MGKKLPVFVPFQPAQTRRGDRERAPRRPPFYKDPAHTVPTKWSLYRPLLRALRGPAPLRAAMPRTAVAVVSLHAEAVRQRAVTMPWFGSGAKATTTRTVVDEASNSDNPSNTSPDTTNDSNTSNTTSTSSTSAAPPSIPPSTPGAAYPYLLDSVRAHWRRAADLTSVTKAREFLSTASAMLEAARSSTPAAAGYETEAKVFASRVGARPAADAAAAARAEAEAAAFKPRVTGGFLRPTLFNVPMPRLKPQPVRVSMTIRRRALRRERRVAKERRADRDIEEMRREIAFWRLLGIDDVATLGNWSSAGVGSWETEYERLKDLLQSKYEAEDARAAMEFTPQQLEAVKEARRARHRFRVNAARARVGLGPLFDEQGNKIPGAEEQGSAIPLNKDKWAAAKARRDARRR